MSRKPHKETTSSHQPAGPLQGWKAIAGFLGLPVTTAQRWGKSGMPVRREGRFTVVDPEELRQWLGHESQMPEPAHIATNSADLAAGLKASIAQARRHKRAA